MATARTPALLPAQALSEHEQLFLVHVTAGADIIQGGVAVVKQPLLAGRAAGLAVAAVVEQEDVVALCGQMVHGGPVGGQVLRVAVEMDYCGAGRAGGGVQAAFGRALRGHEPAVQRRAVFAGETDVFVPQALLRGRAVIFAVGIIKRVLRAGRQAEPSGQQHGGAEKGGGVFHTVSEKAGSGYYARKRPVLAVQAAFWQRKSSLHLIRHFKTKETL